MPLGLLPEMTYDEHEAFLEPGESILIYSDGLVEAHNPQGEMFGFPRLRSMSCGFGSGAELIEHLRSALADFVGPGWEQEDDVTFVTLERSGAANQRIGESANQRISESANRRISESANQRISESANGESANQRIGESAHGESTDDATRNTQYAIRNTSLLADFTIPSAPDNEREAMAQVAAAVAGLDLPAERLERLKTAVGEATMNAMEHGNRYNPDLPVAIRVQTTADELIVSITDHGGGQAIPEGDAPDLEAKLAGLQSPRGWGLFLIRSMVDDMRVTDDDVHHTVELVMKLATHAIE